MGQRSKRAAAVVREATVRDVVDGNTIVLQFQHGVHATMLSGNPRPVLDAVHEVLGGVWQLRCEAGDASRTADPAPAAVTPTPSAPAPSAPAQADWPEAARPGGAASPAIQDAPPPPPAAPASPAPARPANGSRSGNKPDGRFDDQVDMEGDARMTSGSSEQQALRLLQETLGAEKIGEVAP